MRRNARKIFIHYVCSDNDRFEFGTVQECLDVVKGNCSEQPSFRIGDVNVLEAMLHKGLCYLGKGSIFWERNGIPAHQIPNVYLGKLLVEERRSFSFQRFAV